MRSFKIFNRRVGVVFAAAALVFATALPAFAAPLTIRSMELSSTSASAPSTIYKLKFTSTDEAEADAFVVDFCSNTPLYGEDCTTPTDFDLATNGAATPAVVTTTGFTDEDVADANTIRVTGDVGLEEAVEIDITNVRNPSAAGTVYARIITFDTVVNADAYVSNPVEPAVNTGVIDTGSVAFSITPTVGVSGAVLETMTFCVAADEITESCGDAATNPPVLQLGRDVGDGVLALDTAAVSEGTLYAQVSTNAASGAIVNLKSGALNCGGLKLLGSTDVNNCYIAASGTAGIAAGDAEFGVKLGTAAGVGTNFNGTLRAYDSGSGAYYNTSAFKLFANTDNSEGVTSTYGDPLLDTNGEPVNNMQIPIIFGAQIANDTPAGRYSADLSMIATGTF